MENEIYEYSEEKRGFSRESSIVERVRRIEKELTGHADATKRSRIVQTGTVILTRVGLALVHVRLASRSCESLRAVTSKGAGRIHANSVVLARRT